MLGYGKYRSPEEKEEFVKQLGADAKQRVIDLAENWEADAKDVAEFLIFSSRFPDYSVRNQMLIYKQNPYAMLIVLESIYSRLMDNWRKKRHTYIYIDEIMTIFRNPYAAQYFASLWQRIRKRGGYIIGATQNTTEILNSPEARKLLENSYIITMLYQSAPDRDVLAEMFSLSEAQKQALAKEQYGTGLIKVGSTIVPFENDFPTDNPLYQLMSTKPSDGWGQEVNEHYDV